MVHRIKGMRSLPWLGLLVGVTTAFPFLHNNDALARTTSSSSTALPLSLPSIGAFPFPAAVSTHHRQHHHRQSSTTKANKGLWFRDRSVAEEHLTTHSLPHTIETETAQPSLQFPPLQLPDATTLMEDWNPIGKVNLPMVQATCWSHAKLLAVGSALLSLACLSLQGGSFDASALHWNGDATSFHPLMDWSMTPWRAMEGILATIPLVAFSTAIGESDHSEFCPLHFSVSNTVMSLFGRRHHEEQADGTSPAAVVLLSLGIATVSALSEELIFRGLLPTVLESYTHSIELALIGQALLFGMGQIRRRSSMTENGVFSFMQSANGLWYGAVYLGTGGDILPVLIAHVLYECHVFVGAWRMVNDQLDYTEQQTLTTNTVESVSIREQHELDTIQLHAGGSVEAETLAGCRRFFYAFDHEHRGSLCLADVKRAVAFAFLQDPMVPSDAKTSAFFDEIIQQRSFHVDPEEGDRITLSEFLRLLFALKSAKTRNSTQQLA